MIVPAMEIGPQPEQQQLQLVVADLLFVPGNLDIQTFVLADMSFANLQPEKVSPLVDTSIQGSNLAFLSKLKQKYVGVAYGTTLPNLPNMASSSKGNPNRPRKDTKVPKLRNNFSAKTLVKAGIRISSEELAPLASLGPHAFNSFLGAFLAAQSDKEANISQPTKNQLVAL